MSEEKNLVGKKIDIKKLANEVSENKRPVEARDVINLFLSGVEDLEKNHPHFKEIMKKLGDEYGAFMSAIIFMFMLRLSQYTLNKKEFFEMIDRTTEETIEVPTPNKKDMN